MSMIKRFSALVIALCTVLSCVVSASAQANSTEKEEVIYVCTDAEGKVESVNAVNIFAGGEVTDYGDYSAVKMLTTNDKISQSGDEISFSTKDEKVYYQGTMENAEIPWNISIEYFLDGEKISAKDLAGKSGILEIKFKVTENEKADSTFFENYALQAAFSLDTKLCKNIECDGATVANVGSKKQLSYTILAGKGIDTSIKCDVTDFEMDAVSINAVKLNMNIDVDDTEIKDEIGTLTDAVDKLDNGATDLSDGTEKLKDGGSSLENGTSTLSDGISSLDSGITKLESGIKTMQTGINTLNSKSSSLTSASADVKSALEKINSSLSGVSTSTEKLKELTSASSEIKSGIDKLTSGVKSLKDNVGYAQYKALMNENGVDIDTLKAANAQTIDTLTQQISALQTTLSQIENVSGYEEQCAQLNAQIKSLSDIITLLNGNNGAIAGTEKYLDTISENIDTLYSGVVNLQTSYAEFDKAVNTLADTLSGLMVQMTELSSAINQLTEKYTEFDTGVSSYTSGVNSIADGYKNLVSGVSDLASGSKKLISGSTDLSDGATDLYDGISSLCDGAKKLSDGTGEMKDKTTDMDTQVDEKIDSMISSISGGDSETVSFVSDKNTAVDSVQFVIKTEPIEISEPAVTEEEPAEELNFWQKLLRLFGLY